MDHRPLLGTAIVLVLAVAPLAIAQQTTLPPFTPQPPATTNLLTNSGFEAGDVAPWQLSDWPPREETGARLIADSIRVTDQRAHGGEQSLVLDLTTVGADRTLIAQHRLPAEALAPHDGATMRLTAAVLLGEGPTVQPVRMTLRQWGEDGLLDHQLLRLAADVNEWAEGSREFIFRMGQTTRADVNVTVGQNPDLEHSPVVYLDDVRLEVLGEPALAAELPWGTVLSAPDAVLPVAVRISRRAWEQGRRGLRWDITGPRGVQSLAHGELAAPSRSPVLSVSVPDLSEGRYALRLALGRSPGEREHEVLLPFVRAEGPLAYE
jgi:hypothetical protein